MASDKREEQAWIKWGRVAADQLIRELPNDQLFEINKGCGLASFKRKLIQIVKQKKRRIFGLRVLNGKETGQIFVYETDLEGGPLTNLISELKELPSIPQWLQNLVFEEPAELIRLGWQISQTDLNQFARMFGLPGDEYALKTHQMVNEACSKKEKSELEAEFPTSLVQASHQERQGVRL